jgi:tetratricopeptide (TPR) repeat protein
MKKLFILLFVFTGGFAIAQINNALKLDLQKSLSESEKKLLLEADKHYKNQEYIYSLTLYDSLSKAHPDNLYLKYLLGSCECYDAFYFAKAEENIKAAEPIRSKLPDYDFYLGRVYENNDKYADAIKQFEMYLTNNLPDTIKGIVNRQIEICRNSADQIAKGTIATITNIGTPVNTPAYEYAPVLPGNESFMVFAYRGPKSKGGKQSFPGKPSEKGDYFEDIFIAQQKDSSKWGEPKSISPLINTTGNDAPLYLSHDGQKLYLFRNVALGSGDIFVSYLKGTEWSVPEKMKGINSNFWEGSICFSPDEKFVYFSSERPNGLGGRDIWFAQLMPDGNYGNIKNLGPTINTSFDEDAPFITADGKIMFFSSTGHNSTGGYDIFRSDFKNGKWSTPYNIGRPINTNQDDKYYWASADGQRGYYSSERKGGYGLQDIYLVTPSLFGKPSALVVLSGIVYFDDKPVEAEIKIKSKHGRKDFSGNFSSNSATGEYLLNIPSGNEFELKYTYKGMSIVENISTVTLDSFATLRADANLYSEDFITATKMDSSQTKSDIGALNYDDFLAKYGDLTCDSIRFKVQVGAYRLIENFDFTKLLKLPPVRRQVYEDGITRFTLGEYKTLKQADAMCKHARKVVVKDAFVIALYKNKRIPFEDLIKGNYFKTQ